MKGSHDDPEIHQSLRKGVDYRHQQLQWFARLNYTGDAPPECDGSGVQDITPCSHSGTIDRVGKNIEKGSDTNNTTEGKGK